MGCSLSTEGSHDSNLELPKEKGQRRKQQRKDICPKRSTPPTSVDPTLESSIRAARQMSGFMPALIARQKRISFATKVTEMSRESYDNIHSVPSAPIAVLSEARRRSLSPPAAAYKQVSPIRVIPCNGAPDAVLAVVVATSILVPDAVLIAISAIPLITPVVASLLLPRFLL